MASDGPIPSHPDQSVRDASAAPGDDAPPAAFDTGVAPTGAPTGIATGETEGPNEVAASARPGERERNWLRFCLEWLAVLLVAVGVAVAVRTFVVQTFYIPSGSMEPTLMIGDRILVDKLSYHLHSVARGDMVVFSRPPAETASPGIKDLVKRVVGLPGETISSAAGQVWINGKPLSEPWLPRGTTTTGIQNEKIPPNEYFVMGDNRGDSQDSRFFGPIPRSLIVGRVFFRIWPFGRIGLL